MGRIVVGIDGSDESGRALRWAVEEARLRGATVEAVHVHEHTPSWQLYAYAEGVPPDAGLFDGTPGEQERAATASARDLVAEAVAGLGEVSPVVVEPVVVEDVRPAEGLVARSEGAELLVVGSHGRGGLAELLLGSVSHQCASRAHCPVVVVGPGGT